jgi:hypothetical protein
MNISKLEFDHHKTIWSGVAQNNNWYVEPFFIQVWVNQKGSIVDSVSVRGLDRDYVIDVNTDKEITNYKIV